MNGRTSTILTALVVAALVAVGVAYLIANAPFGEEDPEIVGTPEPVTVTPAPVSGGDRAPIGAGRTGITPPPSVVQQQAPGKSDVSGVETSAPTGASEWLVAGLVGMIAWGGWRLRQLATR